MWKRVDFEKRRCRALVVVATAWLAGSAAHAGDRQPPVSAVTHVAITVADLSRSIEFYSGVLSFRVGSRMETAAPDAEAVYGVGSASVRSARLRLGGEEIELIEFAGAAGRPFPADTRGNDRWFQHIAIVTSDMDGAYRRLREHRVRHASSGPQRLPDWNPGAGGIRAFYFRDPDGHFLEILQFPPGKGDSRWQSRDALFLGIDHTAIVVADTDRSLRFYRDTLGLRVVGEGENFGYEQEQLNHVFGARLRITSLRAAAGPGVELLEYLSPVDGRDYPADARPNDLLHWHTVMSARPVERSRLVRDPDGHAVLLTQAE
ncbi:MAG: VOC family protein [Phycisphaerae bacterium]